MDRITLKSIYADPHCMAGENETIPVSRLHPDAEQAAKIAENLVSRGYAVEFKAKVSAPKAATEDTAAAVKAREASAPATSTGLSLEKALAALDPDDPEDWTAAGKPSMRALETLTGNKSLSRTDVDAAFPDFVRPSDDEGGEGEDDDDSQGGEETGSEDGSNDDSQGGEETGSEDGSNDDSEGEWDESEANGEPKPSDKAKRGPRSNKP